MFMKRKFIVRKHERGLLFKQGDFVGFLEPGVHRPFDPLHRLKAEVHDITQPKFEHRLADLIVKAFPDDVARLFVMVETGANQAAVVFRNGRFAELVRPDQRLLFWKGVVDITAQVFDIGETFDVEPDVAKILVRQVKEARNTAVEDAVYIREVPDGHMGLLFVDGELARELEPGQHSDLHRHDMDYYLCISEGDKIAAVMPHGDMGGMYAATIPEGGNTVAIKKGVTEWAVNIGKKTYREILIELKP